MTDAELERRYDEIAQSTQVGLGWFSDELHRRQIDKQTAALVRLTWVIAVLTLVNVGAVILALFISG